MAQATNFKKQLNELEAIVEWFEREDVDLDEALGKFERGIKLAAELKKYLSEMENKVEVIKKRFAQELDEPIQPIQPKLGGDS